MLDEAERKEDGDPGGADQQQGREHARDLQLVAGFQDPVGEAGGAPSRAGDELGGHIVTGHVDGVARVKSREDLADQVRFVLTAPSQLARFIAKKGSVALDGVSLTVNEADGDDFSVLIIPHTLDVTTLKAWQPGTAVHLEVDLMARYAARLLEAPK